MENGNQEYLAKAPTYKEVLITFAANDIYTLNNVGNVLAILDVSGSFKLSIDEQTESDMRAGITFKMPAGKQFRKVRFRETAGAVGNITIAVADGEIYDARANITGNTPVINAPAPNQSLQVDMIAADPGLVALANTLVTALQASQSLGARYADLSGATYSSVTGSAEDTYTTLVTAGANTGGVLIHACSFYVDQTDDLCHLRIDGSDVVFGTEEIGASNDRSYYAMPYPVKIPAGVSVEVLAEGSSRIRTWYEVL